MSPTATPATRPPKWWLLGTIAAALVVVLAVITSGGSGTTSPTTGGDGVSGEALFATNCLPCHGEGATGTDSGPPLIHELYLPGHHSDAAIALAARTGVRPHHWQFGPMPPVPGLSDQDISHIVAYIRSLQRDAGLLEDVGS